ncbi:MAG: hypothetical protein F6K00_33765 [Leptolyngbya sp. SIOISBB]|nr:hypothetical protein [Leptolyngbya sp. SIOISBB]
MSEISYRDALRKVLKFAGLSQAGLCREAENISPSLLSDYLNGNKDIGTEKLFALVNQLPPDVKSAFYAEVFPEERTPLSGKLQGEQVLKIVECFLAEGECDGATFNDLIGILANGGRKVYSTPTSE